MKYVLRLYILHGSLKMAVAIIVYLRLDQWLYTYVTRFLLCCKSTYPGVGAKKAPQNGVLRTKIVLSSCGANTPKRGYFLQQF